MVLRELTLPNRPHLRVLRSTGSTNDDARQWAREEDVVDGATVVADQQTAGRGRTGREWFSPPGKNLYLSQIILAPANRLRLVPLLGALAIREAVAAQVPSDLKIWIKWPNDILARDCKLAGVLCEMFLDPKPAGILGMGINLNLAKSDFPEDLKDTATSLSLLTGGPISRRDFLASLLDQLDSWRKILHQKPEELVSSFIPHCITLDRNVRVSIPGREDFYGTARSIDADGLLLVEDESGEIQRVEAGDVTIVTAP